MLKALLNLAAMSAIKYKGEYLQYFNKRVNEFGKNKMSTLNIIRNKRDKYLNQKREELPDSRNQNRKKPAIG